MTIGTILFILLGIYFPVYAGMICYDLFIKKDPADLIPKQEDEDVDISDEARQFQPILIEKETRRNDRKQENSPPVVQPEKENVKDVKPDNNPQSEVSYDGNVSIEDDEPSNRKSLKDKGSGSKQEQEGQLTPAEKRALDAMERLKKMRLKEYGLSQNNDEGQKTDNQTEIHNTPVVETEKIKDANDSEDFKETKEAKETNEVKTINQAKDVAEDRQTVQNSTENGTTAMRTVSDPVPKRKRYESAKKEMPLPDDLPKAATFNPIVRIDEEAGQTKNDGGQTVEQFESEVKDTFEDKIALARKIAESGWMLFADSIPEVSEEDILEPPNDNDDPPPKASRFNLRL